MVASIQGIFGDGDQARSGFGLPYRFHDLTATMEAKQPEPPNQPRNDMYVLYCIHIRVECKTLITDLVINGLS